MTGPEGIASVFPALDPSVPLLRRGPDEVQLGVDAGALVLTGLSETEIRSLEGLDGSRPLATLDGSASTRFETLVRDLVSHGVVVDAHHPPGAGGTTVAVDGDGVTTRALAALLREAGVTVRHGRAAVDETDLARRAGRRPLTGDDVHLVVGVAAGALSPADGWWDGTVPYLPVLVRPHSVVVGPFVDGSGPCLRCLDLTRADHDPAWATVLAQMGRVREPVVPSPLTTTAAALACSRVLGYISARRSSVPTPRADATPADVSIEMSLDPPRLVQRAWARHPRCARHAGSAGSSPVTRSAPTSGHAGATAADPRPTGPAQVGIRARPSPRPGPPAR